MHPHIYEFTRDKNSTSQSKTMKKSCVKVHGGMSKIIFVTFMYTLLSVSFAQETDSGGDKEKMDVFFLPCNTRPESYDLLIVPKFNGAKSTFGGETKIILVANEPTNSITLNAKDLCINKVTLEEIGDKEPKMINVLSVDNVERNEQIVICLEGSIEPGPKYRLFISYTGVMTNDLTGFYLSSYEDCGVMKWCAMTRLMMTYARRMFPCYDQPSNRVPIHMSVVKRKNQIALSNMPIMSVEKIQNGLEEEMLVCFKPTPLLSTCMVALFVGEYSTSGLHKLVTVYTHGVYLSQTEYIETEAPKLVQVLKDYTGVQLDLPKLDFVDIQAASFDGSHNWGLSFFQDIYLALSDDTTTISKIEALTTVQHRNAYLWFGDLLICKWWDDVWIQHGLERYFKYFALGMAMPDLPTEEWFLYEVFQNTLQFDIDAGPVAINVKSPEEIQNINTFTSSFKSSVIFRMLRYFVSEKLFQLSLQVFLNSKKYGVFTPDDLYSSFDKVLSENNYEIGNGLTVKDFMTSWIEQDGYPYINVSYDKNEKTFIVTQSKFPADDKDKKCPLWIIGLTYTTQKCTNFDFCKPEYWTDKNSKTTKIPESEEPGWYIFNVQATGYYRVNYDVDNWITITKQLNENINAISILNRAILLDDAFSLATFGLLDYSVPLCLATFLKNEINPLVWFTAMNQFYLLMQNMALGDEETSKKFEKHVMVYFGLIQQKLEDMVSKGNTNVDILKAWDVLTSFTCQYNQNDCVRNAMGWFNKWLNGEKIPADIKEATLCTGLTKCEDQEIFDRVLDLYMTSTSLMEKKAASLGLGCSPNKDFLSKAFDKIILGNPQKPLKEVEYKWLIENTAGVSTNGFEFLFDFLSKNLDKLLNETPGGTKIFKQVVESIAKNDVDKCHIEKIKKFLEDPRISPSLKEELDSYFVEYGKNPHWFENFYEKVSQWNIDCCAPYLKQ